MSKVGYYRTKVKPIASDTVIQLYANDNLYATANVKAVECCDGGKYVKYLDNSGRFRFVGFNNKWSESNKPTKIGEVEHLINSIETDYSEDRVMGYTNVRTLNLKKQDVSKEERLILQGLMISQRVFLYIGDGITDNLKDWILVKVTGDTVIRKSDTNYSDFNVKLTLPKNYAITDN